MRVTGQICDRPEAGGRDRRRARAETEVEHLEGPGVHDDRQVSAGRRRGSRRPRAASAAKCPRSVTRYTGTPSAPGTKSPGVAEVSAFACVVSTAVIHNGAASPLAFAARLPITVSRDIASAGTGDPPPAGDTAQPAVASPDTTARTHASTAAARASGQAVRGCLTSPAFMPVGRSPRPAGCMPRTSPAFRR